MIQISHISKHFGAHQALRDCSFTIGRGEIVGLVGKNGAGKTSVLKILSGQMLPSSGEARIDGQPLVGANSPIRASIGYLPEVPPLYGEMTVADYLRFAGLLKNVPKADIETRLKTVIQETGVAEVAGQRLDTLAKGYQQRVGIAQAIIHSPPVVLLDEPMSSLDPVQIVHIRDLILSLKDRHTVLFSSHILSEVTQVCEKVILLDEGSIKAQGREEEIRRDLLRQRRLIVVARGNVEDFKKALSGLKDVEIDVRGAGKGLSEAMLTSTSDVREEVSRRCVEAGLGLLELREERHGLEELMMQLLSSGEGTAP